MAENLACRSCATKKPARLSSKFGSTTASPKTVSTPESDKDHGLDTGSSGRSSEKTLSSRALLQEVLKMAENEDEAELMILELMLLRRNNLEALRRREWIGAPNSAPNSAIM
ncbi:uncharacterized protein Z518_06172 [Rhinocladiella mackenziei CBS 650.93]|uniref:Rhinocladiella mackenziei CBS 650.93 unplaced genomic scaffold supercont1.4, whole genome shotgun sequence n=1 Tax=Rhinocladiella mackenziei CBS 650.93 TaxID=1442369 RepID=A0A0D2J891_9EURO|nr:uncharacterized protein Z518_06172 [Rhinocladiella mackenziei CBS 650.93]KIX05300.1 hypothetical protein Z518_06172 [Rhinocladiella mackenziei CBS 650.93]